MKIEYLGFIPAIIFIGIALYAVITDEDARIIFGYFILSLLLVLGSIWGISGFYK